jgi:hypothetical protein
MGIAHSAPRRVAVATESTFAAGPATDWSTNGELFLCIEPDVSGVAQGSVENENYRPRPMARWNRIMALKSEGSFSFSTYLTASGTHASETASATATTLSSLLKCAMGGRDLGYAVGVASSSTNTVTVDTGEGSNYEQGDFIFLIPTSSSDGQFYRVQSVSTDTLTLDRNVHATADNTGTIKAVIDVFFDQDALTKSDDANHTTLAFLFEGEDGEDNWDLRGCKVAASIDTIEAGQPVRVAFDGMHTTFLHETLSAEGLTGTYEGEGPLAVGTADDTLFLLADNGSSLASTVVHSLTPTIGVGWEKVTGPNGTEGVHGYIATGFDAVGMSCSVRFDDNYATDWRAQTEKHALLQVGTTQAAIGFYWPRLEYAAEPSRGQGPGGVLVSELQFKALEDDGSINSLTGDSAQKWYSPMHILIVA